MILQTYKNWIFAKFINKDNNKDNKVTINPNQPLSPGSLADLVARKGPLPEMLAAKIIKQVIECLRDCHSKGVVIQDLELDHFVITSSEE